MYKYFFKRLFDFALSLIALVLLLPFFLLFTPIVAFKMKGNPFFVQKRPGKKCKIFRMFKYRTMTNARDNQGNLLPDSERLTKFGKIMRKTSIDELPELFNILLGQMSFVGPRPLLIQYLELYSEKQMMRQNVRPGLTGLAQVSGRNAINWEQKFNLDVAYVTKITFMRDLKILIKTFVKVFKREGITSDTSATMEFFLGNEEKLSETI